MFYLSQQGTIAGPFSTEELLVLKSKKSWNDFRWIWDTDAPCWKPIDPPPSSNPEHLTPARSNLVSPMEVLCEINHEILSAVFNPQEEQLAQLVFENQNHLKKTPLTPRQKLNIYYIDAQKNKSKKVKGIVEEIKLSKESGKPVWIAKIRHSLLVIENNNTPIGTDRNRVSNALSKQSVA